MKLKDTFPHIIAPVINKNTRINAFIISICLFIIIIIWSAVTFQLRFEKKEAITAAIQQNSKDAIAFEQYVLRTVESIDAITKFVKIEYQRNGKNTSITKLIADQAIDTTLFKAINIMDEKGNLLFTSYTKVLKHPVNVFNEEHFQVHLLQNNDKIFISRPLWSENFESYIVTLTRRINKSDGTFGGIVSIPIDPARFTKLFVKATLPPHYIISLVRFDGITIARLTGGKESSGENIIKSPLFNYIKKQPNGNYFAKDALHGIPTYFSYRTLQNHPLLTTVGTAEEDVLAAVNQRSKWDYISAVFGTLIILFFTWLLIRTLMRRKRLEEKLRQNELRFRSLIENNNDAIVLRDKDFNIIYCSPASKRILGWTNEQRLIENFDRLMHPEDLERIKSGKEYMIANPGKPVSIIGRMKHSSGKYIWTEGVVTNLLNDNNVNAIISNFRDITERKKAEEEIKESEAKYRAFFENSMDGILLTQLNGNILSANPSACAIFNMTAEEICASTRFTLVDVDDPRVHKLIEDRTNTGRAKGELTLIRKGNIKFPGEIASMVFKDAYGNERTCMIIRDITERKKSENEIKESEAKYRAFFDNSIDGILLTKVDGNILSANPSACEIFNMTEEELLKADRPDLVDFSDPRVHVLVKKRRETGRAQGEMTFIRKGNIKFPGEIASMGFTDAHGEERTCMLIRDITERKKSEEKIIISNERFLNVSKATFDIIWDWDIKSRKLYFGDGFKELLGYELADNIGDFTSWSDHIHPEDKERIVNSRLNKLIHYDQLTWKDEYRYIRADGSVAHIADRGIMLRENGSTYRMIGAMQDITEAKENEIAINELNQKLKKKADELLSSNYELERFAYVASHDLQEPLRMVSSFLQLLDKKYTDSLDETAQKYIHFALDGSERMKILINELLEYSRLNSVKIYSIIDLNDVVVAAKSTLKLAIEEAGAKITIAKLPQVYGNDLQLTQLFQNLISNALKYKGNKKPVIEIGFAENESAWQFFVKDNGIGIDKKYYVKIFMIFQRLHDRNEYSGTGIGLAICKKIVELHNGNLWVESTLGEGSTFYFTISKSEKIYG